MSSRNARWLMIGFVLVASATFLAPVRQASSEATSDVRVMNFPEIQEIRGRVALDGTIRLAQQVAFRDILVPPVQPTDTTRLVEAGMLETDGFPELLLSLHGFVKGSVNRPGAVGVILVPEEPTVRDAFDELGLIHFPLRATATGVSSGTPYFASDQPRHSVGFTSYRVLLYNTTDKTVTANVFAYLRN